MYFYFHINLQKSSQQPIFLSVALLNQRTDWISRPSSSKDVQINVSTSLGNKQRFDHNKRNRCLAKNHNFFRIFKRSWWKWEKAYICLVRSNHSRCNSWPLPGRQTPPWLWRRRKRPPRQCSSSPGWISKIRTDGAALSRLPKCNHGGEKYLTSLFVVEAASEEQQALLGQHCLVSVQQVAWVENSKWSFVFVRLNLNSSGHLIYLDAAGSMRGYLRTYYYTWVQQFAIGSQHPAEGFLEAWGKNINFSTTLSHVSNILVLLLWIRKLY